MKNVKLNVLEPVKNVVVEEPIVINAVPTDEKEKSGEGSHEELKDVLKDAGMEILNDTSINTVPAPVEVKTPSLSYEEAPEMTDEEIANLEKHPLNFMRKYSDKEFNALIALFDNGGYDGEISKVTLAPDVDDNNKLKVGDGYHTLKACLKLGIKPAFKVFKGTSEQILLHVLRAGTRRNLSPRDAALLVITYEKKHAEILEKEALKRKSDGGKNKGIEDSPEKDNPKKGRTDDLIAELLGVNASKTTIGKLKKIIKESEDKDLFDKLIRNEITVDEVMSTKEPKDKGGHKAPLKPKKKDLEHDDDIKDPEDEDDIKDLEDEDDIQDMEDKDDIKELEDENDGDEDEELKDSDTADVELEDGDTDDMEHNYLNVPPAKPDNQPLKPILTESYVKDKTTKALMKLIDLQTKKKVIEEKIKNLGAGDTTELRGERSGLIHDIHMLTFEFGFLLLFGKPYDHETMKNFDELAILIEF